MLLRLHLHRWQGEDSGHHVGRRLQRVALSAQVESQGEVYQKECLLLSRKELHVFESVLCDVSGIGLIVSFHEWFFSDIPSRLPSALLPKS